MGRVRSVEMLKRIAERNAAVRYAAMTGGDIHGIKATANASTKGDEEPGERGDDDARSGGELDTEESGEGGPDDVGNTEGNAPGDNGG